MSKIVLSRVLLAACLGLLSTVEVACVAELDAPHDGVDAIFGNGAPSGGHFNLNLIGVARDKSASLDNNDGRRIFVPLFGSTKILLREGDFAVIDANGTDGSASFQLPAPAPDGDGITEYSV